CPTVRRGPPPPVPALAGGLCPPAPERAPRTPRHRGRGGGRWPPGSPGLAPPPAPRRPPSRRPRPRGGGPVRPPASPPHRTVRRPAAKGLHRQGPGLRARVGRGRRTRGRGRRREPAPLPRLAHPPGRRPRRRRAPRVPRVGRRGRRPR